MPSYSVYLQRSMSKSVDIEAESVADAIRIAYEEHDISVNISNDFEEDGDLTVYSVDEDGERVYDSTTDPEPELPE